MAAAAAIAPEGMHLSRLQLEREEAPAAPTQLHYPVLGNMDSVARVWQEWYNGDDDMQLPPLGQAPAKQVR
jgi:hypothetical protein